MGKPKVLSLNARFTLPSDFERNENDAIREFLKYRETVQNIEIIDYTMFVPDKTGEQL